MSVNKNVTYRVNFKAKKVISRQVLDFNAPVTEQVVIKSCTVCHSAPCKYNSFTESYEDKCHECYMVHLQLNGWA